MKVPSLVTFIIVVQFIIKRVLVQDSPLTVHRAIVMLNVDADLRDKR